MILYLETTAYGEQTVEPSDDGWSRGDTSTSWDFGRVLINQPKGWSYETIETGQDFSVGDEVHLVVVVYSTGDSFGWDYGGRCEIMSAHKNIDNATESMRILEKGGKCPIILPDGYEIRYYLPWDGYFESLDYITIVSRAIDA